jgi:hypothetical protein
MNDKFVEIVSKHIYSNDLTNVNSGIMLRLEIEKIGIHSYRIDDLMLKIENQLLLEENVSVQLKRTKRIFRATLLLGYLFLILSIVFIKFLKVSPALYLIFFGLYFVNVSKYNKVKKEREYRKTKIKWWLEELEH